MKRRKNLQGSVQQFKPKGILVVIANEIDLDVTCDRHFFREIIDSLHPVISPRYRIRPFLQTRSVFFDIVGNTWMFPYRCTTQ